jgi:hypothetical protein
LKLSGLARSTFYHYLKYDDTDKYACEKQEIVDIYNFNKGRYGYRRITIAMRNKGYVINHKTVQKLMNNLGLKGKQRKNDKYHSYKGTIGKVADNLLKRDFYAENPFEKITTDVTQFNVCDEKIYLSPVLDLYNNEVVTPQRLFDLTWNILNKEYYEPDLNNQDWARWKRHYTGKIQTDDDAKVAIDTMIASLDEPYTRFMNTKEYQDLTTSITPFSHSA